MHGEAVDRCKNKHACPIGKEHAELGARKKRRPVSGFCKKNDLIRAYEKKKDKYPKQYCSSYNEKFIQAGFFIPVAIESGNEKKENPGNA